MGIYFKNLILYIKNIFLSTISLNKKKKEKNRY